MPKDGSDNNRRWAERFIGTRSLEPAQAYHERMISLITFGVAIAGALADLCIFFFWLKDPVAVRLSTAVVGVAVLLMGLAGYALSRAGRVTMAAWLTLLAAVSIGAYSVAMRGITSANAIIFAPTVALAGMLVGSRGATAVVAVEVLIAVVLGLAQGAGWRPPLAQTSVALGALVVIGALAFLLLLNGLSWRLAERSLALAEAQTEHLRLAHQDQRQLVADLKVQSHRQAQLLATVRELFTPVIPVSEGIIVLPLVGHVDVERLEHIRSTLMDGIAQYRARVVLLEMTGLRELEGEIALGLLGLTDAARLLGAELVVVGVQPGVARVVVKLDADTSRLVAQPDLQSAIAYAVARRGDWLMPHDVIPGVSEEKSLN